jgi:amino acid transporter
LANIATQIGGKWLGAWTVFAAGISNLALFEAEMSRDAFQLMGMANRGLFPKIFSTQSKYDTPTYGIMLGTFFVILMSVADFAALVEMLNFAYSLALLIEFAAFIKLRVSHPHGMCFLQEKLLFVMRMLLQFFFLIGIFFASFLCNE